MQKYMNNTWKLRLNILFIALAFGILSWIADAIIDYFFFFDMPFRDVFYYHLTAHMTFERIMIIVTFIVFGIIVGSLVIKQKEAEEELHKHEVLKSTIESLSHPFYVVDAKDYSIVLANSATKNFISSMNPKCFAVTHRRDVPCNGNGYECPLEIVKATKKDTVVEHKHFDKNGNQHIFEVHGHPIFDKNGNVNQMIEYSIEITKRKQLEYKLLQRTNELKSLVEQSTSPIAIYGKSGELLEVNNEWKLFFNENSLSKQFNNILDCEFLAKKGYKTKLDNIVANGGGLKTEPLNFEKIKKKIVFNIYVTKYESGTVSRIVCQLEDRTNEIKQLEMKHQLQLQKKLSSASFDILEQERKRVSKELHDQIGQKLLLTKLGLEMIEQNSDSNNYNLTNTKEQLLQISKEIKEVIFSLHPAELKNYGLIDAVELMLKKFSNLTNINSSLQIEGEYKRLNEKLELNIYRIIQEAMNNVSKHSQADKVEVKLSFKEKSVEGFISDNGNGFSFDFDELNNGNNLGGYGLISMFERTKLLGGTINLDSKPGEGTKISFKISI